MTITDLRKNQILDYRKRTVRQHLGFNPQIDSLHTVCMIDAAMELKGINGLADFYFQKTPTGDNPRNNKDTYNRLVRGLEFQDKVAQKCWN